MLTWRERGGPPLSGPAREEGFGTLLARVTVQGQLGGQILRDWQPDGLEIRLSAPLQRLAS